MDAHDRPLYLRLPILLVVVLLHSGLLLIFRREKLAYTDHREPSELPTEIFFIDPRPAPAPPETSAIAHQASRHLQRPLRPLPAASSHDANVPSEREQSAAPPSVDWSAEAHRAATEILAREKPGRAVQSPAAPTASAPWDLRPLLESTGHGLTWRLPLEIPGKMIDHCFGNMDLGHDERGHWEKYQLGCALNKQPSRGDLFDSLRKPSQPAE